MGKNTNNREKVTKPLVGNKESAELFDYLEAGEFELAHVQLNRIAIRIEKEVPDRFCKGDILVQVKNGDHRNAVHLAITHHKTIGPKILHFIKEVLEGDKDDGVSTNRIRAVQDELFASETLSKRPMTPLIYALASNCNEEFMKSLRRLSGEEVRDLW